MLGISIPPLLMLHFLGTVVAHKVFGIDDAYDETVLALVTNPGFTATQIAAVLVTWIHGCIGITYWLRLQVVVSQGARRLVHAGAADPDALPPGLRGGGARSAAPDAPARACSTIWSRAATCRAAMRSSGSMPGATTG